MDYTIEAPDGSAVEARKADSPILAKIRKLEGSGDTSVSPANAIGRFQITPDTAAHYNIDTKRLTNADYNERSAERIVSDLEKQFPGDEDAILVAYNAGPGRARQWIKSGRRDEALPAETRKYLDSGARQGRVYGKSGDYQLEGPDGKPIGAAALETPRRPTPTRPATPAPKPAPSGVLADATQRTGRLFGEATKDMERNEFDPKAGIGTNALRFISGLGDEANAVLSPVGGAVEALARRLPAGAMESENRAFQRGQGRPVKPIDKEAFARQTGQYAEALAVSAPEKAWMEAAEGAKMLRPGQLSAAGRAVEKARMAAPMSAEAKHAASVQRLEVEGVKLTPGMRQGGAARTAEEAKKSSPYVGQAHEEADRAAIESVNVASYNRALKPIGQKYAGPAGHEGVKYTGDKLSEAYNATTPHVTAQMDQPFGEAIAKLADKARKYGPDIKERFNSILSQDVHQFFNEGGGKINGETFKRIDSELGLQARRMAKDQSNKEKGLGDLVGGLRDALHDNVGRHSPPGVAERLKSIDAGWAILTRVEQAAAKRAGNVDGIFNVGDLQQAVKDGDATVRHRGFARGDALMQDLANDAGRVVKAKLPDSGTARRAKQGLAGRTLGGLGGAALGSHAGLPGEALGGAVGAAAGNVIDVPIAMATNALARHGIQKAARSAARQGSMAPRNYLKAINARVSPLVQHGPAAAGGLNMLRVLAQQQPSQ